LRFASVLRAHRLPRLFPALCQRTWRAWSPPFERLLPLCPRGPRSGPGYSVPVHHHLSGPMRPTCRHTSISPSRLYEMPSLCVFLRRLDDPRVDPCFRWRSLSACRPLGPQEVHWLYAPSSFAGDAGLRPEEKVSALPKSPPSDSRGGLGFRGLTTVRFRYNLPTCSPSCRS